MQEPELDPLPETPLYHYTSLEGLLGITETKSLRATHIAHLNDSRELTIAIELLEGAVGRLLPLPDLGMEDRKCLAQLTDWLAHRVLLNRLLFTFSFTEAGNLLSQWRAYCPPSAGVSLGFDAEELLNAADAQGFQLVKCVYDPELQTILVNEWLNLVLATKDDMEEPPSMSHPSQSYHAHFRANEDAFLQVAARMKHPGFAEEMEWRLVSKVGRDFRDPNLKFRAGRTRLIPFIEFEPPLNSASALSLRHVYIGPAQDHEIASSAIHAFLARSGVTVSHGVSACEIPLRNW